MKTIHLVIGLIILILVFFYLPNLFWSRPTYTGSMHMVNQPMFMMGAFLLVSLLILLVFAWPHQALSSSNKTPHEILEERLARSEIDLETYQRIKQALRERKHEK